MTGLQIALASGTLIGLALALLVWRLAPSDPDLVDALDRLSPDHVVPRRNTPGLDVDVDTGTGSAVDRIGLWAMKNLPGGAWAHTPRKDLAILQISETRFYGEKVVWALLGLIMPPLLAAFFTLIGLPLPFAIPTLGSLALAALFWFMPNYNAADDAKKARIEFSRAWAPTSTWWPPVSATDPAASRRCARQPRSATSGSSSGSRASCAAPAI